MDVDEFRKRVARAAEEVIAATIGGYAGYEVGRRMDPQRGALYTVAGAATGKMIQEVVSLFAKSGSEPSDTQLRVALEQRASLVYLVRGKDGGQAAWHYVLVDKPKLDAFKRGLATGSLDVSRYGKILYSGWGQDPPANIVSLIEREYRV
jgi:hypothetical protein